MSRAKTLTAVIADPDSILLLTTPILRGAFVPTYRRFCFTINKIEIDARTDGQEGG